ncbi:HD domain-containing protein [Lentisalinibacter orientalis]|uniref:HD domain-containing protein n=1 Tax=Lentisalinibacter orientalis TaxID=2992241 RepID=UPI00386AA640
MSTLERAIQIAASAHAGQTDKAGKPYILHPLRVMLSVSSDEERMAAVLHDVLEDTHWTPDALRQDGFSEIVVEAVVTLTKTYGESRIDAAQRAARNPVARRVKLADVTDSMDLSRIANPQASDYARLEEYEAVRRLLLEAGGLE